MSFDNPNDPPNDGNKTVSDKPGANKSTTMKSTTMGNLLNVIGLKKPTLRLVKTLNATTAKIIPFKAPLGLIVGGFALSIYALV